MISITLVNSKFKDTIDKFHFNPFRINQKTRKYFINLQTQWLFDINDELFSDGDISGYYVNYQLSYKDYLKMKDNYQNIKFKRIIYTEDDKEKYGDEIPFVVNKLDDCLFLESNIGEIKIPDSIVKIGDKCFNYCESLTSITISSGLTKIGEYAFSSCSKLLLITLPSVLTSLNKYLFYCCNQLTTIEYSPFVDNLEDGLYYQCSKLTKIDIPSSITRIGDRCFYGCNELKEINVPTSVVEIGTDAFKNCSQLRSITGNNNICINSK